MPDPVPDIKSEMLIPETFESEDAVFLLLLRSATQIVTTAERTLRELETSLTAKEWDVLAFVRAYGPIRPADLLRKVVLMGSPQTLSSVLRRLEHRELVARSPDGADSRSVLVSITEEGIRSADEVFPVLARKVIGSFNAHFSDDELDDLGELLRRL